MLPSARPPLRGRRTPGTGATTVIVRSVKPNEEKERTRGAEVLTYGLTLADLDRVVATVPTVTGAGVSREAQKTCAYLNRKFEGRVVAVQPGYFAQNGLRIDHGRLLTERGRAPLRQRPRPRGRHGGKALPARRSGRPVDPGRRPRYRVVGVIESKAAVASLGGLAAQDYNHDAYIPFASDHVRNGSVILTLKASSFQVEKLEVSQIALTVDRVENVRPTAKIVEGLLDRFHTRKDTQIVVPLELLERAEQTQRLSRWCRARSRGFRWSWAASAS